MIDSNTVCSANRQGETSSPQAVLCRVSHITGPCHVNCQTAPNHICQSLSLGKPEYSKKARSLSAVPSSRTSSRTGTDEQSTDNNVQRVPTVDCIGRTDCDSIWRVRTHGIFLHEDFWFLRIDERTCSVLYLHYIYIQTREQELFRANQFGWFPKTEAIQWWQYDATQ